MLVDHINQILGKPLFEMWCFHMGIARPGQARNIPMHIINENIFLSSWWSFKVIQLFVKYYRYIVSKVYHGLEKTINEV